MGRIILQNFMFKLYLEAEFRHKHIFKIHALSRLFFFVFGHMIEIWLDILLEDKIVMLMVEPTQTVLLARFLKSLLLSKIMIRLTVITCSKLIQRIFV